MSRPTGDRGSAAIEFVGVGIVILMPLVYLLALCASLQSASFAAANAAREAGRVFVTSTAADAHVRAHLAARLAWVDQGIEPPTNALRIECDASPCLTPGALVRVRVSGPVPLPLLGTWAGQGRGLSVEARHTIRVGQFEEVPS